MDFSNDNNAILQNQYDKGINPFPIKDEFTMRDSEKSYYYCYSGKKGLKDEDNFNFTKYNVIGKDIEEKGGCCGCCFC